MVSARIGFVWSVVLVMAAAPGVCCAAEREWPDRLSGTAPLELVEPLDVVMVRGISRYAENELTRSPDQRASKWQRDYSSSNAYRESIAGNRERLRTIIGAVDDRVPVRLSVEQEHLNAETPARPCAVPVSWSVLEGVNAEGLLVLPRNAPRVAVVLVPDASWEPEQLVNAENKAESPFPLAAWLAESDCLVLIPALINRDHEFSGHPEIRATNIPHREFVYRMAFEMGRHIIGYEVQKLLAAADLLKAQDPSLPLAVCGAGDGGLLAMYAAAVDERFDVCLVSGYFQERENLWREPLDRNVWSLLSKFGDAEIASLIAPRKLIIEACRVPEFEIPNQDQQPAPHLAAPGRIQTANVDSVREEFARAVSSFERLGCRDRIRLVVSHDRQTEDGEGPAFSDGARTALLSAMAIDASSVSGHESVPLSHAPDPHARQQRQLNELVRFTQRLLHSSDKVRNKFWGNAKRSSIDQWTKSADHYRNYVHENMIGKLSPPTAPLNARTRKVLDEPSHVGYEVVLDVYPPSDDSQSTTSDGESLSDPGIIAGGILLLPKDLRDGEQRPVVVFQHGLEGTPMDTITTDESSRAWKAYKAVSTQLVERGYIVYAPQNPYRGMDAFRVIQRKSNPLGRSLFSYIIEQHRQTLRWLATLPWVDADRIAFYGLSYGGKTAARVPPLLPPNREASHNADSLTAERSALSSPGYCLSICSADFNEWIRKNVSSEDRYSYVFTREYEMFEWNMGHVAGYAELATLMTPRPFMVERGHNDGVAPDEWVAWEFAKVRRHYAQLGIGDRARIEFFNGPHTINGQATFEFLDQHLKWSPRITR